ncbi:hypothetical protein SAZ10_01855 [Mesorhizobium sp. BAC0120]|uniref:hypothetical protein n=1 Tax=Mesorhizobium sp. BAC0120 TaxID=3090670 RepID=UPI00298BD888|nr:hypothetical protein [Mesorhizobium sp. BAC0120]MDW6020499.1 hypothetical protein [Mesorhizobium sp. BAC0120]
MTIAVDRQHTGAILGSLRSPLALLAAAVMAVLVLLSLPLSVPIGPMYWDSYIYYDGASRIFNGQIPNVDYFAPVGPLGYYLFAGWLALFPDAQPTLITHWALLAITAPLMGLVLWQVDARSRATAWALLIPFLIFSLLPFNGREFYPFPSSDGFGIYNRQVCQMLYVLIAALLYVRNQRILALIVAVAVTALFFLKITGFIAAGLICLFAFLAGRICFRYALAATVVFPALLGASEFACGMVTAYVADIEALVKINSQTLLPRILQSISINFGIIGTSAALSIVLLLAARKRLAGQLKALSSKPSFAAAAIFLDNDVFWLAVVVIAGIIFEAQNTGSQAFIFLWPVLWNILARLPAGLARPKLAIGTAVLVAAVYLPMTVATIERAVRTYAGASQAVPVPTRNLKALGSVTTRYDVLHRAETMLALYPKHQQELADIAEHRELPSPLLYSDLDFQVTNLMAIDRTVDAIRALEAKDGIHFDTIMTFALANPLPYLMDRGAPRLIAIGADPFRAVPEPDQDVLKAVADVDLALYPKCPGTWATVRLWEIYGPALKDHRKIELDPCFMAYVSPRLAQKIGG